MTESNESQLINVRTVAEMLGISLRQVWRLNATARLPKPIRLGGSVKWRRSEILAWLGQNCPDRQTWDAIKANGEDSCSG